MRIGTFANEIILFILHSEQHEPARGNKEGDPSLHLHVVIEHVFPQRSKQMLFFPFESGHVASQMHAGGRFYLPDWPREIQNMLYKYRFRLLYYLLGSFYCYFMIILFCAFFLFYVLKCMLTMLI